MKKTILTLIVLCFSLSCSSLEWNETNKKGFMDACNADGGLKDYCECYLDQLIKDDINVLEAANLSNEKVDELTDRCISYVY